MGAVRFLQQIQTDMKVLLLCLAVTAHGLPVEPVAEPVAEAGHIIKYDDEELGHGHVQTGVAGEMVEGALYYKVPEGDTVHLTYTAVDEVIAERRKRDADPVVVPEPEPMPYPLPYQYQPISYH